MHGVTLLPCGLFCEEMILLFSFSCMSTVVHLWQMMDAVAVFYFCVLGCFSVLGFESSVE